MEEVVHADYSGARISELLELCATVKTTKIKKEQTGQGHLRKSETVLYKMLRNLVLRELFTEL